MMEDVIEATERRDQYQMWQQLERDGALETLSSQHRRGYEKIKSNINQRKDDLQTLHHRFKNDHQLLGRVFSASGFKQKNFGLGKDGENYSTHLDWALVHLSPAREPSNNVRDCNQIILILYSTLSPHPFEFYRLTMILSL